MGDSDNLYVIESIVDKRFSTALNSWRYQIKWKGFDSSENTWEPEETVQAFPDLLEEFNWLQKRKREQYDRRNIKERAKKQVEREKYLKAEGKLYGDDARKKLKLDDLLPSEDDIEESSNPPPNEPKKSIEPKKSNEPKEPSWKDIHENLNKMKDEKKSITVIPFPKKKPINSYEPQVPQNNNTSRIKAEIPRKSETYAFNEAREEALRNEGSLSSTESETLVAEYKKSPEESNMEDEETSRRISNKLKEEINKGNWKDLQPARILGCRRLSGDVYYAVLFKIMKDGTIPPISIVSHKDMKMNAPKMLDKFLLENMVIC